VPESIAETQARVAAQLGGSGQPFRYVADGSRILGSWDIADVSYQGLASAGTIDEDYALTVTLDEGTGRYSFTERTSASRTQVDASDGTVEVGGSRQVFRGRTVGKQWGGGFALSATSSGRPGHSWSYEFDTSRIKQPLFALLESAGWQPTKKGLLARLFSR
jgi:hypothetical protein